MKINIQIWTETTDPLTSTWTQIKIVRCEDGAVLRVAQDFIADDAGNIRAEPPRAEKLG
jgi:hypothetical protein